MRFFRNCLIIAVVSCASSCKMQPDADELIGDMVVVTNYDETVDFDNFTT